MSDAACYLLLVHRSPAHLRRLAGRLLEDGSSVLVHVDRSHDIGPFRRAVAGLERVAFTSARHRSGWGTYGLVEAELALLREALATRRFSHAVLMSGQDYPITSAAERRRFFAEAEGRSFMSWSDGTQPRPASREGNATWYWDGNLKRVAHRYYWFRGTPYGVPNRLVPWFPKQQPPGGMRIYQGSQWWALDPLAAEHCVRTFESRHDLVRYFRRVLGPDEYVFQMLLLNSPLAQRVVNQDLIYQDFDDWHARSLTAADIPKMARSPKLFGRKIDTEVDPYVPDTIDRQLLDGG